MSNEPPGESAFRELEDLLGEAERWRKKFIAAWSAAEPPRIEDFLPQVESPAYELVLLSLIGAERRQLHLRGVSSPLANWLERFPQSSDLIREHWTQLAPNTPDPSDGSSSKTSGGGGRSSGEFGGALGPHALLERVAEGRTSVIHRCATPAGETGSVVRALRKEFLARFSPAIRDRLIEQWLEAQNEVKNRPLDSLVRVLEAGYALERPYARLELVESASTEFTSRKGELLKALKYVREAVRALETAHAVGWIHGAVRPTKMIWLRRGGCKISGMEWGRSLSQVREAWPLGSRGIRSFIAPELLADPAAMSPACDVFSLGVVLYRLLTGVNPYGDLDTTLEVTAFPSTRPIPIRRLNPDSPRELEKLVQKCLEQSPKRRFGDLAGLGKDLDEAINQQEDAASNAGRPSRGYWSWLTGK